MTRSKIGDTEDLGRRPFLLTMDGGKSQVESVNGTHDYQFTEPGIFWDIWPGEDRMNDAVYLLYIPSMMNKRYRLNQSPAPIKPHGARTDLLLPIPGEPN